MGVMGKWGTGALLAAIYGGLATRRAVAHAGLPPAPHDLWTAWNWDWPLILGLILFTAAYHRGVSRLWRRVGVGRGLSVRRVYAFYGGTAALVVALVSPLDALSDALFSAHMVQHLLLVVVAAPLLVVGMPLLALLWAVPSGKRRRVGQWWHRRRTLRGLWGVLSQPLSASLIYAVALWGWHAPLLYQAALRDELIHVMEHGCFLGAALLFWWVLCGRIYPSAAHVESRHYGIGILMTIGTALHSTLLSALITFASTPWYISYLTATAAWGLTPLQDQQLAGVLMWIPMGLVYLGVALGLLGAWLHRLEERDRLQRNRAVVAMREEQA